MNNIEIAKEWMKKAQECENETEIKKVMDKFISLFIAYNALYSSFYSSKQKDRACATTVIAEYLINHKIVIINECQEEVYRMIKPVEDGLFCIYGDENTEEYLRDDIIIKKIKEDINNYRAILNFIYGIRINLFHGKKQILAEQLLLLNPANLILEKLLNALINEMSLQGS